MPDTSFFAVFDGHGGDLVAMMSKDKLLPAIHRTDAFQAGSQVSTVVEVATDSVTTHFRIRLRSSLPKPLKTVCLSLIASYASIPSLAAKVPPCTAYL